MPVPPDNGRTFPPISVGAALQPMAKLKLKEEDLITLKFLRPHKRILVMESLMCLFRTDAER